MDKRNTHVRHRWSLLAMALAGIGAVHAQDSGVGVDLHFGNGLDPSGMGSYGCDEDGPTWLAGDRLRTPTGFLFGCIPDRQAFTPVDPQSGWQTLGTFQLGYLHVTGDEKNAQWRKFNDFDDGVAASMDLSLQRPADGSYADLRASRVNEHDQFYRAVIGRAGKYRIQTFGRTQSNVTSGNARSIWEGVGSEHLTLKAPLLPAGSTSAQTAAVSAAQPEKILRVVRDKFGLGVNYFFNPRWTGYVNASHEQREGARPFGGPMMFNFFPLNNSGGIYEIPRPIDDSTVNFNAGLRFSGNAWRMEFGYNGSFFRNAHSSYDYQVPIALTIPVIIPIPGASIPRPSGEFAYEPENDHNRLFASFTRKFGAGNEFSLNASAGRMRQNDDLLPPMNCQGRVGLLTPVIPAFITTVDCNNWNTTAALSQKTADLSIDTRRLNARLVIQPNDAITWRSSLDYNKQDYQGDYHAYNPLTGQWGYLAINGGLGTAIPGEFGIFDPVLFPSALTRVRNLTLDKTTQELSTGLDWRINQQHAVGATLTQLRTQRDNREVDTTRDNTLKLSWNFRNGDWLTLRTNYVYSDRSGSDYNYDPYEFTFSTELPGFVVPNEGIAPHTVDAMRKYDLSNRTQHKVDLMGTFSLPHNMTLYASGRMERNDYDAQIGRQGYDTQAYSLQWEWQPGTRTVASAWVGADRSKMRIANVNDVQVPTTDHSLGGTTYPEANRWWMQDSQRNTYAGANLNTRAGRVLFDFAWNWIDSRGTTRYWYNSPGALATPPVANDPGRYPDMGTRINTLTVGMHFPITTGFGIRVFDTYERGDLSDWHYQNFANTRVYDHRAYTDGGPENYSVNTLGVMLEFKL